MATYNGEKYILKQIQSILSQLSDTNEVIVVDDCSLDNTVNIIKGINDDRIKIYHNKNNMGHVKSFEKAISISSGDYIFLSDQDDIWKETRLENMIEKLVGENGCILSSTFDIIDEADNLVNDRKVKLQQKYSKYTIINILNIFMGIGEYWGCTMCFNRKFLSIALPIPKTVISHDIWFALVGICTNRMVHYERNTLSHRRHSSNLSPRRRRSLIKIINTRVQYILHLMIIVKRILMK